MTVDHNGRLERYADSAAGASEGQAEPVAYMRTYRAYRDDQSAAPDPGVMVTSFHQNHEYAKQCPGENTPLYAHPSAEIAALRERIAILEHERDEAIAAEEKVQELHDALFERIAGMEKDAQRYRYLRNCGVIVDFTHGGPWKFTDDVDKAVDRWMETRTPYIDAAIAKEKQG